MPFQYISSFLNIPEIKVINIQTTEDTISLEVQPIVSIQPCPYCHGTSVNRCSVYQRTVRHLPIFGKKTFLLVPSVRLFCKECLSTFIMSYEFVEPKKQFTRAFLNEIPSHVLGSTVKHAVSTIKTSYTTLERHYKVWLEKESERVQQECFQKAVESSQLVLGIDDFAIRKGHTYNTGLHDLRGGTFLDIALGRTVEDLRKHYATHPQLFCLQPVAVVMDLAKCYHTFIQEVYPNALRIADRYHVNRLVTEALQKARREVQKELSTHAKKRLKEHHRTIGKRKDALTEKEQKIVKEILNYSTKIRAIYEWKEAFITWYDSSTSFESALNKFRLWCEQGRKLGYSEIDSCVKTMINYEESICNYHKLRFTNAAVEGRHNKIKALQRRHYFTRNRTCYEQRILVECNEEHVIV